MQKNELKFAEEVDVICQKCESYIRTISGCENMDDYIVLREATGNMNMIKYVFIKECDKCEDWINKSLKQIRVKVEIRTLKNL